MDKVFDLLGHLDVQDSENKTEFEPRHGYLYCIKTSITKQIKGDIIEYVKLGKTSSKPNEKEEDVRNRLFSRYKTYYPETVILELVKVRNCDKAEREMFHMLRDLRVSNELFVYQSMRVYEVMQTMKSKYKDISVYLKELTVEELNSINKLLYEKYKSKDIDTHMQDKWQIT